MDHKQIRIEIAVVLPPIMLITGREWRPSKKELLQWGISYPDTDLPGELRRIGGAVQFPVTPFPSLPFLGGLFP